VMTRFRCAALVFTLMALAAVPAAAQVNTPSRGSATRAMIMDAMRKPVQRRIGKAVIFVVKKLRVLGPWAFLEAEPRNRDGSVIDYTGTRFESAVRADAFGGLVHGLLRRVNGRWGVVTLVVGASDVPYVHWWRTYGAPRALFPYSED
jgi:hypothetical protein